MDFTLSKYTQLIRCLKNYGFESLVLRHDVDRAPQNSLRTALIEKELGMSGIYYFRAVPESWDEGIVRQIAGLGHEIGYHYESLTTCHGDLMLAFEDFRKNLDHMRTVFPIQRICMHGSPRSPYDSKDLWKKYNYKELGIKEEPYLDTDFSKVFYLTDTGRRWDGYHVSIRDKIPVYQEEWTSKGLSFHSTDDLLTGLKNGIIPRNLMITVHPQRWNSFGPAWCIDLVSQRVKNLIKRLLLLK